MDQTGNDTDVGRNHPKSYIWFITIVRHQIYFCVFVLWGQNLGSVDTYVSKTLLLKLLIG